MANWEVRLLKAVTPHPFIFAIIQSFQDNENAYILMKHISWGDLLYHMKIGKKSISNGRLTEEQAKILGGCLIIALYHIHSKKLFIEI